MEVSTGINLTLKRSGIKARVYHVPMMSMEMSFNKSVQLYSKISNQSEHVFSMKRCMETRYDLRRCDLWFIPGYCVSSIASSVQAASGLGPILIVPQLFFSGYILNAR